MGVFSSIFNIFYTYFQVQKFLFRCSIYVVILGIYAHFERNEESLSLFVIPDLIGNPSTVSVIHCHSNLDPRFRGDDNIK